MIQHPTPGRSAVALLAVLLGGAGPALAAQPYEGRWADGPAQCGPGQIEHSLVFRQGSYSAYGYRCDFGRLAGGGGTWTATSRCSGEDQTWTERDTFTVQGDTMAFRNDRGESRKMVRCAR